MSVVFTVELTGSQKLALVDALLELIRIPGTTQTFHRLLANAGGRDNRDGTPPSRH